MANYSDTFTVISYDHLNSTNHQECAILMNKNTKEFETRKNDTLEKWAKKEYDYNNRTYKIIVLPQVTVFKNDPVTGIEIKDLNCTYSSKKEWFYLYDPRGFKAAITCSNLLNICKFGCINKGILEGNYVWGTNAGGAYLFDINDPELQTILNPVSESLVNIGDEIQTYKNSGIFIGNFYKAIVKITRHYSRNAGRYNSTSTYSVTRNKDKVKLLYNEKYQMYFTCSTFGKNLKVISNNNTFPIKTNLHYINNSPYSTVEVLFENKVDMMNASDDYISKYAEPYFK